MTVQTKKFSEFTSGGDLTNNDITVGYGGGTNLQFDNPWTFLPSGTTADRPAVAANMYYRLRFNTDLVQYEYYDAILGDWTQLAEDLFAVVSGQGTANQVLVNGTSGSQQTGNLIFTTPQDIGISSAVTFGSLALGSPLTVPNGGTGLTSTTINQVLFSSSNNVIAGISTLASAVFITSAGGVPSWSTTLPAGLVIPGYQPTITPAAFTKVDDTNVTATLGGSPSTAVLNAMSFTLGWTGILSIARGGTAHSSVTTVPAATSWAGWDANSNFAANNLIPAYTTTVTSVVTATLTVASAQLQYFTGSTAQTVVMPVVSTLPQLGTSYTLVNNSSASLTVDSSGSNTIITIPAGGTAVLTCILLSGTTAASWNAYNPSGAASITGTANQVLANGTTGVAQTGAITLTLPQSIATTSSVTFNSVTTTADSSIHTLTIGLGTGSIASNTALGLNALLNNTTGYSNVAVGQNSMVTNTTGHGNVSVGPAALFTNSTGNSNTAVGSQALSTTTASSNTGVGDTAGAAVTSGLANSLFGAASGLSLTTGSTNTFIGAATGLATGGGVAITSGDNNTFLGYIAGANSAAAIGTLALGYGATATIATGVTSGDAGPGIAIGSASNPVGFRGDAKTYAGGTTAGYWRPNINGVPFLMPLFVDATLTANAFMITNGSGIPVLSTTVPSGSAVTSITGTANQVIASASTGAITLSLPQSIATTSAVQFNSVQFNANNALLDSNGNVMASFSPTASATNHLKFVNNIDGSSVELAAAGVTSSSINIRPLGGAGVGITTTSTTFPFAIYSGTGGQHATQFAFTDSNATRTVTYPDSTFTIAGTTLALGGTNNALTAANGGIVYSNATQLAILAATATAQQLLLSGSNTTPQWSTTTYPLTNAINTIMYASSANIQGVITPTNSGVLVYSAGGVPSASTTLPSGLAATNLTLTTPALGTPSSGTLTSCTGLPISTGVSGLGAGVATLLGGASSGTGGPAGTTSPTFTTPTLGAALATSINFGGTSLSIYSDSTFTPVLKFGGGTTGITYTRQLGTYIQIGSVVHFVIDITLSSKGSSTGGATITGLPVTSRNVTGLTYVFPMNNDSLTYTSSPISASLTANATTLTLVNMLSASAIQALADTNFANTSTIFISGFYFV